MKFNNFYNPNIKLNHKKILINNNNKLFIVANII